LGADGITIRADVADEHKGMAGAQHFADLCEGGIWDGVWSFAHGVEPLRGGRIVSAVASGARINDLTSALRNLRLPAWLSSGQHEAHGGARGET
jgi:hypothetical protein